MPYFDTFIKKHIFINLTSLNFQKGPEPLKYIKAKSLQKGVAKKNLNKTNKKIFLVLWQFEKNK